MSSDWNFQDILPWVGSWLFWHMTLHDPEDEELNIEINVYEGHYSDDQWYFWNKEYIFYPNCPTSCIARTLSGNFFIIFLWYAIILRVRNMNFLFSALHILLEMLNISHSMYPAHMSRTWSAPCQTRWLDRRRVWSKWSAVHRLNLICLHSGQHGVEGMTYLFILEAQNNRLWPPTQLIKNTELGVDH